MNVTIETEPFIFVDYQGTNSTPLSERIKNDPYNGKCKYDMDNLGIDHLLLRLAQEILCKNDEKRRSHRMYLVANDNLVTQHYSKIGLKN